MGLGAHFRNWGLGAHFGDCHWGLWAILGIEGLRAHFGILRFKNNLMPQDDLFFKYHSTLQCIKYKKAGLAKYKVFRNIKQD